MADEGFELGQVVYHRQSGQKMVVIDKNCTAFGEAGSGSLYKCEWQKPDGSFTWYKFAAHALSQTPPAN